ncbi:MAG: undecaprenyldiphospho-muramoylpentapeptide beta-N-acetylglucosaminyltransferase [Kiloniellales bacterium]
MRRARNSHIVLTAGGTGGHMFPAQALARALLARGQPVALITDRRGAGFGPELPQAETYRISAGALLGGSAFKKLSGVASLAMGYFQAKRLLRELDASAVIGFGGYASVPAAFAASRLGIRVVLHEQNAVMGRANRLLAKRATVIATCFAEVEALQPGPQTRVVLTGNPVRPAIAALARRPYPVPGEGDRLRLLVTGGSQGAKVFNEVVPAAICRLPEHLRRRLQISQQVPGGALDAVAARYRECGVEASLAPFIEDMPERLAAAHLAICRAGASTTAELTVAGRPAILVPYPFAADDHQTANAHAMTEAGGGWLLPQSSLTADRLAERLISLLATPALLAHAARCARAIAHDDAAERLADVVCGLAGSNGGTDNEDGDEAERGRPGKEEAA